MADADAKRALVGCGRRHIHVTLVVGHVAEGTAAEGVAGGHTDARVIAAGGSCGAHGGGLGRRLGVLHPQRQRLADAVDQILSEAR